MQVMGHIEYLSFFLHYDQRESKFDDMKTKGK